MPPKQRFFREHVLDAAFAIARDQGVTALTARAVADRMNASTAPVYRSFRAMSELEDAVMERAMGTFEAYLMETPFQDPFLDTAYGVCQFASDEPYLYHSLVQIRHRSGIDWESFRVNLLARVARSDSYRNHSEDTLRGMVDQFETKLLGVGMRIWLRNLDSAASRPVDQLVTDYFTASAAPEASSASTPVAV